MSSERPDYMSQIDRLLEDRGHVVDFVESGLRGIGGNQFRHLKQHLKSLRDASQAETLLASPELMRFLPLLRSFSQRDHEGLISNTRILIEEQSRVSANWSSVFSYPSVMFMSILGIFVLQASFISPTFENMYSEFDLRLSKLTKTLFALNHFTRSYAWLIIPAILLSPIAGKLIRFGLSLMVAELQKLYVIDLILSGRASNLIAMSRFVRVLADLCELGTPIPNAVQYAGVASSHALYRLRADQLAQSIRDSTATQPKWEAFPPYLWQALNREGQSEPSSRLLRELAFTYSNQAGLMKARFSGATSPWLVLFLGGMMFFIALAMFSPTVSLVTSLSGGGN